MGVRKACFDFMCLCLRNTLSPSLRSCCNDDENESNEEIKWKWNLMAIISTELKARYKIWSSKGLKYFTSKFITITIIRSDSLFRRFWFYSKEYNEK